MTKAELITELEGACKRRHMSRNTFASYRGWLCRFIDWAKNNPQDTDETRASEYLGFIAENSSEATQNQALNAIVFMHKHALRRPLGELPTWTKAKRPKRLPSWVTAREAFAMFEHMRGESLEMGQMMFGAGLRLTECLRLRVKDVDFDNATVTIRGGKGDKDRTTLLPHALIDSLRARTKENRYLFEQDQKNQTPGVMLPEPVGRKYQNAGKQWEWFWLWPGKNISRDPETGIKRRHHIHKDTFAKSVRRAKERAQITKRVTAHSFRHGFATALILAGTPINEVQELLGHTSIQTTEVYLHCLPRLSSRVQSPLDVQPDIVPFTPAHKPTNTESQTSSNPPLSASSSPAP